MSARVFYATAESIGELIDDLTRTVAPDRSKEKAETFLLQSKIDAVEDGDDPKYWDRVKIFKVTVEEVGRETRRGAHREDVAVSARNGEDWTWLSIR